MAFYVTIRETGEKPRTCFAAGPFNRHGDAERCVGHVRRYVHDNPRAFNEDTTWLAYGTSRVRFGPLPTALLNGRLGLPTSGRIAELELPGNRWWTEGDPHWEPKVKAPQRRPAKVQALNHIPARPMEAA